MGRAAGGVASKQLGYVWVTNLYEFGALPASGGQCNDTPPLSSRAGTSAGAAAQAQASGLWEGQVHLLYHMPALVVW